MKKKNVKFLVMILLLALCVFLGACGTKETEKEKKEPKDEEVVEEVQETGIEILDDDALYSSDEEVDEKNSDDDIFDPFEVERYAKAFYDYGLECEKKMKLK